MVTLQLDCNDEMATKSGNFFFFLPFSLVTCILLVSYLVSSSPTTPPHSPGSCQSLDAELPPPPTCPGRFTESLTKTTLTEVVTTRVTDNVPAINTSNAAMKAVTSASHIGRPS